MKPVFIYFAVLLAFPLLLGAQKAIVLKIDGTINPVTAEFVKNGIQKATNEKAACLLIELNTPGGLLKSTRVIVGDLLNSPVPVIVYVSPAGAHAGSAGVFITMAANIAAMAPGTNIGAAHPVNLQGQQDDIMTQKATNDAAAFIRTITQKRKRNLEWAEDAVRNSVAITANEALEKNVVDLIAGNTQELLTNVDGRKTELDVGTITLHTKGAQIELIEMSFTEKLLDLVSDPDIAYMVLLLGIFGIMFELFNPGAILPGIVGVICLVLAFYSMQTLPINYAGLALIFFGIILFLLEIKIVSHGLLAAGGIVSLLLGSMMLIQTRSGLEVVGISKSVIASAVVVSTLFFVFVLGAGLKAQRLKPVTGVEGLENETGKALETLDPFGRIQVHGETWNAESISGKIYGDEKVRVVQINNLTLRVEKITGEKV